MSFILLCLLTFYTNGLDCFKIWRKLNVNFLFENMFSAPDVSTAEDVAVKEE